MTAKGDILVVDDTTASLQLISRMLKDAGYSVRLAGSGELALSAAEAKPPELILLDVRMPGLDGFEVFRLLKAKAATRETPVIFLTAGADSEEQVTGLKLGAVDYITKPYNSEGLLAKVRTHTELYRLTEKLKQEAAKFRALFENSNDAVFMHGMEPGGAPGKFIEVNDVACTRLGYTREELLKLTPADISVPGLEEKLKAAIGELLRSGRAVFEMEHAAKDGRKIQVEISSRMFEYGGKPRVLSIARDIAERKKAEAERLKFESSLRQAQKMETIGLLAGGVAHDFNNILSAIMCNAGFLAKELPPGDPKLKDVKEILASSERAATLTRQLLAFSRRQIMATRIVDVNGLVGGIVRMLGRVIGERTAVAVKLNPSPCTANVDPAQIEQVIMNLALNARDAMPGGGIITLETEIPDLPEEFFDIHPDLPRGKLICLRVSDTGSGMSEEVKAHLFEPFFTTKEQGKGTGLGLSTVFGIVKQSRGEIIAESEPGKGSAFSVYLPFEEFKKQEEDADEAKRPEANGNETVLLVEDEESLRRLGERILLGSGYKVLVAADGEAALKLMEERGKPVDLLISDVVMPGMSGRELGLELQRRKLVSRALYMSGYTDEAIVKHGVLEPGIAFIYKPYTVEALLLKLRETLAGPAAQAKV